MTGRVLVVTLALGVGALTAGGLGSCASTIPAPPIGIDEPPTLRISSPYNGACVVVPNDSTAFVPVTVDVAGSFFLRPPGMPCDNAFNCGYLALFIDGQPSGTSATATINANVGSFGVPYGTFKLTVELVFDTTDGGGTQTLDAMVTYDGFSTPDVGVPELSDANVADPGPNGYYQTSVTITTAPSCGDAGLGGAGGAGGSGGAGGAHPDAGTGGAGPSDAGDAGDSGTGGASSSGVGGSSSSSGAGGGSSSGGGAGGAPVLDAGDAG
jgi:hypothetical protein